MPADPQVRSGAAPETALPHSVSPSKPQGPMVKQRGHSLQLQFISYLFSEQVPVMSRACQAHVHNHLTWSTGNYVYRISQQERDLPCVLRSVRGGAGLVP